MNAKTYFTLDKRYVGESGVREVSDSVHIGLREDAAAMAVLYAGSMYVTAAT